ncbi:MULTISPECIES: transglycosylase [unclassified Brevundimonas]|uniref:transglycosylase n=1 Tax=unclassified Brevundimonas TaxID=2622653 RepID=UPI0025C441E8|nr:MULTISPECIES: transglycosylase [unclassified Brevundimonas]
MQYADIAAAIAGGLLLAWIADLLTGRRGFGGTSLVSGVGLACGWFLAVRVFAISTMDSWVWAPWALVGSGVCLVAFFLFRNKR